jgi:hypothetical protein
MKHLRIISIALFIIFSYASYVVIWGLHFPEDSPNIVYKRIGGSSGFRLNELEKRRNIDVLITGSSHAYRGIDSRYFEQKGIKTFNMGSSSQTPIQTKWLLKKHLDKLNPKLVILEVDPSIFCSDGIESSLDIISNYPKVAATLPLAFGHLKTTNTYIFSLYHSIFKKKEKLEINWKDNYHTGGYVERKLSYYQVEEFKKEKWDFNVDLFDEFEEIIDLLKSKNIHYVLVQAPLSPAYYSSHSNNQAFDDRINKLGTYYNYNDLMKWDNKTHFYDKQHLNTIGARRLTAAILQLKELP